MNILLIITASLIIAFVFGEIAFRFRYPRLIGQLFAGIVLGFPIFKQFFTPASLDAIKFLSELGIIFLFLMIGLKIDIKKLRKTTHDAIIVSVLGIIIPFALGFIAGIYLGYSVLTAVVVGTCLSITAEATTAKLMLDLKMFNTRVGRVLFGTALLNDLFGILAIAIIIALLHNAGSAIFFLPLKFIIFALIVYGIFKIMPRFLHHIQEEHSRTATLSSILIIGLTIAALAEQFQLSPILGAFLAGVIIQWQNKHICDTNCVKPCLQKAYIRRERESIEEMRVFTYSMIIPFFFIFIGLQLDITQVMNYWYVGLIILLAAFAGKTLAAVIAHPFTDLSYREKEILGWGMNARGAVELVIAELARANGLIPIEIYFAIVVMAIVSTVTFPIALMNYAGKK